MRKIFGKLSLPNQATKFFYTEGEFKTVVNEYTIPGVAQRIARADVARFLLKVAEEGTFKKETVAIAV